MSLQPLILGVSSFIHCECDIAHLWSTVKTLISWGSGGILKFCFETIEHGEERKTLYK